MTDLTDLLASIGFEGTFRQNRTLGNGPVAESWLVDGPDGQLVLRRDRPLAAALGLDREAEWTHLQLAYAADLAPEPLAYDSARGLLLTRYLDGPVWGHVPAGHPGHDWATHGKLMRRVHDVPAGKCKDFDVVAVADRYRAASEYESATAHKLLDQVISLVPALEHDGDACFCHNDAHRQNVIGSGSADGPVRLIDWEYAARGNPLFDLAVISRFHALTPAQNRNLLAGWGLKPIDLDQFGACCTLYDALAALWSLAVKNAGNSRPD